MRIRPMRLDDVEIAERITAEAFTPGSGGRDAARAERWRHQLAHIIEYDEPGCWVAEGVAGPVGVAAAIRRDSLWVLSTFAVRPALQRQGVGRALLDAAIDYGAGCLRGLICALPHAGALRRYRAAGFTLHPTFQLSGGLDHDVVPDVDGVRPAGDSDLDLLDSVDRRLRGAVRGPDHAVLAEGGAPLVCDLLTGSGYVYRRGPVIGPLAATNRAVAQRLMWAALREIPQGSPAAVRYLTSDQEWAIDVGLAAGLGIERDGCLALRHMRPPAPYLPSVSFG